MDTMNSTTEEAIVEECAPEPVSHIQAQEEVASSQEVEAMPEAIPSEVAAAQEAPAIVVAVASDVPDATGAGEAVIPFDLEKSIALLEALLLAHGEPVPVARLQEIMKCSREEFGLALAGFREKCAGAERGIEAVTVASKIQLRTKATFAEQVRELMAVKPRKLSQAALETLAVIAYQQPVVKSEVDKIRGVDVAPTIKTLLERKLVKIIGYQATVGQPALYGTTEDFLKVFGLKGLSDLPNLRDLKTFAKDPGETGDDASEDASEDDSDEDTDGSNDSDVTAKSDDSSAANAADPQQAAPDAAVQA